MPSANLPTGNEIILDAYLVGLFAAATIGAAANPPASAALVAVGLGIGALNLGDPLSLNSLASHWRDDLGGEKIGNTMKDLGVSVKNAYDNTVGGSWTGDAQSKFNNYLDRLDNIGWQFDETGNEFKASLQNFAIAVLIADIAIVGITYACAGIMAALLPGMIPVGETAPAISAVAGQLLLAIAAFAGQVAILAATGQVQVGNIEYQIGLLTKKIWADGNRDADDVTRNNNAIIAIPPVRDWRHDPSLDR